MLKAQLGLQTTESPYNINVPQYLLDENQAERQDLLNRKKYLSDPRNELAAGFGKDLPDVNPYDPNKSYSMWNQPKKKVDPYFGLRGFSNGLNWLSNRVENNRQDKYMYDQFNTLGQNTPANLQDYQPNPYNLYAQKGGRLPITTTDPNDPKLKSYQDSLSLYSTSQKALSLFQKNGYKLKQQIDQPAEFYDPEGTKKLIKDFPNQFKNVKFNSGKYSYDNYNNFWTPDESKYNELTGKYLKNAKLHDMWYPVALNKNIDPEGSYMMQPPLGGSYESASGELARSRKTRSINGKVVSDSGWNTEKDTRSVTSTALDNIEIPINIYKKPVQPYVYKKELEIPRLNFGKIQNIKPESQSMGNIYSMPTNDLNPQLPELPYRVEYTDEQGQDTHRDFVDNKLGEEFQKSLSGNRQGYYKKKGGMIKKMRGKLKYGK